MTYAMESFAVQSVSIPAFTVDIANIDAVQGALSDYQAQLNWMKFLISLPLSLVGLAWQSHVGSLGAHFGTKRKCSKSMVFAVFFILGLVGLGLSYTLGK